MKLTLDRTIGWTFFLVLCWTFPFPLIGLEGLTVPAARFIQLAASLSILVLLEGAGGMVGALLLLLWLHALFYAGLLYALCAIVTRKLLPRAPDRADPWLIVALCVLMIFWGVLGRPYDTSFHHSDAHASLMELYR